MFEKWFGKYSVRKLPTPIQSTIKNLNPKGVDRLERQLRTFIYQYSSGKKDFKKDGVSLASIVHAQNMLEELQNDVLWKKFRKNQSIKKINELISLLNNSELTETHVHIGQTTEVHIHWKFLVRYWKLALKDKSNMISILDDYAKKDGLFATDVKKVKKIMGAFISGKQNEVKSLLEMRDVMIMRKRSDFATFCKKANLFNAIDEVADQLSTKAISEEFSMAKFKNVVAYCKDQNITHAEIRLTGANLQATKQVLCVLQKIQKATEIQLRLITFGGDNPKDIIAMHKKLTKKERSFIVAMDLMRFADSTDIIKYAKLASLPLCVHAGEFYGPNEIGFSGLNASQRIERSLRQVLRSVQSSGIARIGHANILSEDITKYLGHKDVRLEKLRRQVITALKKNNVVIEANPTSNSLIANFTYKHHPIKVFLEEGIKFTISTDDRVTFNTNLKRDYIHIALAQNLSVDQVKQIIETGQEARLGV